MEITKQDLEHVCRVCMNSSVFLVDIFAEQTFSKHETSLVVKLNECVEPQVKTDDKITKKICKSCIADVEASYRLKQNYELSFKELTNQLRQSESYEDVECIVDIDGFKPEEEETIELNSSDEEVPETPFNKSPVSSEVEYKPTNSRQSNAKGYTCRICSQVFVMKSEWSEHRTIHIGERPYLCSYCPRDFGNVSDLKTHTRVHTGERPYKCTICSKGFSQMSNLTRHLRVHNNDRNFKCPHCPKDFKDKISLKTHVLLHAGKHPFVCPQCSKVFTNNTNLTRHIRSHTGERRFVCPHCPTSFMQAQNLNKHMKLHSNKTS